MKEGIVCVSDGVGGVAGGAEASRFIAEALSRLPLPEGAADLKEKLFAVNEALLSLAAGTEHPQMAATLTGIFLADEKRYLFHVGNTRAFVLQGDYLKQLTDDHTLCERLRQMGQTEEAKRANPSELIGCFGGGDRRFAAPLTVWEVPDFRTLLLTSDGVHDHLDTEAVEMILISQMTDEEKCRSIRHEARQNGSTDDISVVIIRK